MGKIKRKKIKRKIRKRKKEKCKLIENEELLDGVNVELVTVLHEASKHIDFRILEGIRSKERQLQLIRQGHSKIDPALIHEAPHVKGIAVDIVPLPFEGWGDFHPTAAVYQINVLKNAIHERGRFYFLAGVISSFSFLNKVDIRWGGDWDGDGKFKDQVFDDLVHFELKGL